MSTRLFRHTLTHRIGTHGLDTVLGGCEVPGDGKLNNVHGQVSLQTAVGLSVRHATMYRCTGRVLPVDDLRDSTAFQDIWDETVPKDSDFASGIIDLDEGANTTTFFEPGEPNWAQLADMQVMNPENLWYNKRKLLTFVNSPRGFIDGAPDTAHMGDFFQVRSGKRISAEFRSAAILAVGLPAFDDVTTNEMATLNGDAAQLQLKYIEVVLEQAWMALVGLTEAGAESPWEDAANMIGDFLEPTVEEETAGSYNATSSWDMYADMTWDISVPGRKSFGAISVQG